MLVSDILLQLGNLLIWAFGIIADSTFWGQWCACWASATGPKTIRRQRFHRVTSKSLESAEAPSHFGESSGCWPILTPKKTAVEKLPLADLKRSWVSHLAGSNSRRGWSSNPHTLPKKKHMGTLWFITRHYKTYGGHMEPSSTRPGAPKRLTSGAPQSSSPGTGFRAFPHLATVF